MDKATQLLGELSRISIMSNEMYGAIREGIRCIRIEKKLPSKTQLEGFFICELQQAFDRKMTRAETAKYLENIFWNNYLK